MSQKWSLLTILLAFVACVVSESDLKDRKVVIVGAGAAGIAAARTLMRNGYKNVQILEAQDYYGGRIRHIFDEDGQMIEFGAERIEGRHGNSAYKVLQDAGIAAEPDETTETPKTSLVDSLKSDDKLYVLSNGEAFPIDDLKPYFDAVDATMDEVYNSTERLSDFYQKTFAKVSDDSEKVGLAMSFTQIFAETHSPASDWEETLGIGFGQQKKLPGGDFHPPDGMKSFLDALMGVQGQLNDEWKHILKLNCEVTNIEWNSTKPVVSYMDRITHETHTIEADFVIVTVSLGVLKANHEKLFSPQLPANMTKAIDSLNFGLENQIYLKFSERWWPEDKELAIIWRPEDKSALQVNDRWLPKIETYAPYNNDTLMVYVMEGEKYHSDDLTEQELIDKIMPMIRRGFRKQGWNITNPKKVYHSKWFANPFVRGALTYPSVKSHENGVMNSDLAQSLRSFEGMPNVFFAGEATSNDFYGSVHGAVDSGVLAAQNVMAN